MSDPIVSEVRQSRKAIFARFGNDLHRLCAAIRERGARLAQCDSIRPTDPNRVPSDFQLNGLALFGFCREAIRRRVKPLVQCFCKRREED